jgi:hypothetical protein
MTTLNASLSAISQTSAIRHLFIITTGVDLINENCAYMVIQEKPDLLTTQQARLILKTLL